MARHLSEGRATRWNKGELILTTYRSDADFVSAVVRELRSARERFPEPDGVMTALVEEVGEVARALLDESRACVFAEAVQVAAMACRVAVEGDPTLNDRRALRGLEL